jgi:hypothetical protein
MFTTTLFINTQTGNNHKGFINRKMGASGGIGRRITVPGHP